MLTMGVIGLFAASCSKDAAVEPTKPSGPSTPQEVVTEDEAIYEFNVTSGKTEETRATYVDKTSYMWDENDHIKVYMFPSGLTEDDFAGISKEAAEAKSIFYNKPMEKVLKAQTKKANFKGKLTASEIEKINEHGTYDYYSYGPLNCDVIEDVGFPYVDYTLEDVRTTNKNDFACRYMLVRGKSLPNEHPVTWLDENGEQVAGKSIGFIYEHMLAFLALQIDVNLMGAPVTKIEITSLDNVPIAGKTKVNLMAEDISNNVKVLGDKTKVTVNITNGFTAGDDIMVCMAPGSYLSGKRLNFAFFYQDNANRYVKFHDQTITAGALTAGKKHRIKFKLPFKINFEAHDGLPNFNGGRHAEGTGWFKFRGADLEFRTNGYMKYMNDYIEFSGNSDHAKTGMIRMPKAHLGNMTEVSAYVKINASAQPVTGDDHRNIHYAVCGEAAGKLIGVPAIKLDYRGVAYGYRWYGNDKNYTVTFTSEKPYLGLDYGALRAPRLKGVEVYPLN